MKRNVGILAAGGLLALCAQANADLVVDLGGGWQATIFDEINVGLAVDYVSIEEDILVIQKFANFVAIDPFTGQPEPVRIGFNQIASDALTVSRIFITDELIANNTGLDWTSYQNVLLGGPVAFDPVASESFTFDPFTTREYRDNNRVVEFAGGIVADGTFWTPGVEEGALVINIDLDVDDPAKFILKEIPTPAPGAVTLLGVAGLFGRRRRRA